MTSLFEAVAPRGTVFPLDFINTDVRGVSLLEFVAANAPEQVAAPVAVDTTREELERREDAEAERARQVAVMVDAAREAAANETRSALNAKHALALEAEKQRIVNAGAAFDAECRNYFAQAEAEVVRLALAIAGKILQREMDADPACLLGAVRAALIRVQDGSGCTLRVAPGDVEAWQTCIATHAESRLSVEEDRQMQRGDCRLETSIGTVELGAATQLSEVARTFRERRGC